MALNWTGIIGGAIKGLGDAGSSLAGGYIKDERDLNLEKERSKIIEDRTMRLDEYNWNKELERNPQRLEMEEAKQGIIRKGMLADKEAELGFRKEHRQDIYDLARDAARANRFDDPITRELNQHKLNEARANQARAEELGKLQKQLIYAENAGDLAQINAARKALSQHERIYASKKDDGIKLTDVLTNLNKQKADYISAASREQDFDAKSKLYAKVEALDSQIAQILNASDATSVLGARLFLTDPNTNGANPQQPPSRESPPDATPPSPDAPSTATASVTDDAPPVESDTPTRSPVVKGAAEAYNDKVEYQRRLDELEEPGREAQLIARTAQQKPAISFRILYSRARSGNKQAIKDLIALANQGDERALKVLRELKISD
jgi:hypothetical protein